MIISKKLIEGMAPDVIPKAQERRGLKNPFISLQSLESLCQGEEVLVQCLRDVILMSLRYAETVCQFEQIVLRGPESNEDGSRKDIESIRSSIHDATIASINGLSRILKKHGRDNGWINSVTSNSRASYAAFAILVAFEAALQGEET